MNDAKTDPWSTVLENAVSPFHTGSDQARWDERTRREGRYSPALCRSHRPHRGGRARGLRLKTRNPCATRRKIRGAPFWKTQHLPSTQVQINHGGTSALG